MSFRNAFGRAEKGASHTVLIQRVSRLTGIWDYRAIDSSQTPQNAHLQVGSLIQHRLVDI